MKLALNAMIKFIFGILLVGAPIFISAGTLCFINGWLFIGLLFIPILILGTVLLFKSPELLKKRLDSKEKENVQKGVVAASALLFLCGFIVAGLDFRFGWSSIPTWVVATASAVVLISYVLYAELTRENAYLSRTVKVEKGQTVVDGGLYRIVRHPMYAMTVWLFLSIPIVLGSWWSLLCFIPYIGVIALRIINEEKLLEAELKGYKEYKSKIKYRLFPLIW